MLPALQQLNSRVHLSFKAIDLAEEADANLLEFELILLIDASFPQMVSIPLSIYSSSLPPSSL